MSKVKFTPKPSWLHEKIEGSSQILDIYFDKENTTMYIRFSNGSYYSYSNREGSNNVNAAKFKAMANDVSAGSYFHRHFKNKKNIITKNVT